MAFYAARIEAARRGAGPTQIAAAVRAIVNEETVALRALGDRQHGAEKREREEWPARPAGIVARGDSAKGYG